MFSFAGFAEESLQPAPPLGFNLTFRCPEGTVLKPTDLVFSCDNRHQLNFTIF